MTQCEKLSRICKKNEIIVLRIHEYLNMYCQMTFQNTSPFFTSTGCVRVLYSHILIDLFHYLLTSPNLMSIKWYAVVLQHAFFYFQLIEKFSLCLFAFGVYSSRNSPVISFVHFPTRAPTFFLLFCEDSLSILNIRLLYY